MTTSSEGKKPDDLQKIFERHHTLASGEAVAASAAPDTPVPENDLTRLLAKRGRMRSFKPDPVPEPWVHFVSQFQT